MLRRFDGLLLRGMPGLEEVRCTGGVCPQHCQFFIFRLVVFRCHMNHSYLGVVCAWAVVLTQPVSV